MNTERAKEVVRKKYVNAWVAKRATSTGTTYFIVPWDEAIGSIGFGRTESRAWKIAAESILAKVDQ